MSDVQSLEPEKFWPDFTPKRKRWSAIIAIAIVAFATVAVKFDSPLDAASKPSLSLEQCANLGTTCDTSHSSNWQSGNLGSNNSEYLEGESVPFRSVLSGLTIGQTYMVSIQWDSTENGGHHAYDYITSFGRTEGTAAPCAAVTCTGATSYLTIPLDAQVSGAGVTQVGAQSITVFGGTFPTSGASVANAGNLCGAASCTIAANPGPYSFSGSFASASQTGLKIYVTAASATAVLAWGGHVSSAADWGVGNSATALSGSPYHMRIIDFACTDYENCSAGNMDRSMSANAIVATPTTTTTLAPTTTTTLAPTTTTTLAPTTTTTLAPTTTTTLAPTTTLTPTTTTVAPSTTVAIAAATTTTVAGELQVINPAGTGGVDGSADTLFPDELPKTGWRVGMNALFGALIIIVGASLLTLTGTRRRKTGDK